MECTPFLTFWNNKNNIFIYTFLFKFITLSQKKPMIDFLVVITASGSARARLRTTTTMTTESRKIAAILQLIG